MKNFSKIALAFAIAGSMSLAYAGEKEDVMALVNDAAKAVTANKAEAVKNIQNGVFVKGSLYAFAYDLNGVMVAHPQKPTSVGTNFLNQGDDNNKMFRKDIIEAAKKGGGWVDYTLKGSNKTAFCKKAADLAVCSAIVKG